MQFVFIALAIAVVCGFVGAYIAAVKGRPIAEGFVIGFLLAHFGVLVEALLPSCEAIEADDEEMIDGAEQTAKRWLRELPK